MNEKVRLKKTRRTESKNGKFNSKKQKQTKNKKREGLGQKTEDGPIKARSVESKHERFDSKTRQVLIFTLIKVFFQMDTSKQ